MAGLLVKKYDVLPPGLIGGYAFSILDAPGVVAANTFVSVFNPSTSTRTVGVASLIVSCYSSNAASTLSSLALYRVTAASAGTLQAASAIAKLTTAYADSICEVRTLNPTVTLGALLIASPPAISSGAGTSTTAGTLIKANGPADSLILAPGEGIAMRTAAGDVDHTWNVTIGWSEI